MIVHTAVSAQSFGERLNVVGNVPGSLNIGLDVGHRSQGELSAFVYRAELAMVPGAVARQPQQKALGFIGRPNGAGLEAEVSINHFLPLCCINSVLS